MKIKSLSVLLSISAALVACDRGEQIKYVEKEKVVVKNPWGTFEYKPVSQAPDEVKKAADSVVFMRTAQSSGSGFLIEHKGEVLLVTNEHVLGRNECTVNGCVGVIGVRGFYPGGPNQRIESFRPLLISKEFDTSLFRTTFKPGEVPTLKVETADKVDPVAYSVGHPSGSTSKYSVLNLESADAMVLLGKGGVWHGNSGGPLIGRHTGKVLGIVSAYSQDQYLSVDGYYEQGHISYARRLSFALSALDQLDNQTLATQKRLRPASSIGDMPKNEEWFISIGWRLDDTVRAIAEAFPEKDYANSQERVNLILDSYATIYRSNAQSPLFSDRVSKYLMDQVINDSDNLALSESDKAAWLESKANALTRIDVMASGKENIVRYCSQSVTSQWQERYGRAEFKSSFSKFWSESIVLGYSLTRTCLVSPKIDFQPILDKYSEQMSRLPIENQEDLLNFVATYLRFHNSSDEPVRSTEAFDLLKAMAATGDSIDGTFGAEGLIHMINARPEMVGKGWLKSVSDKQFNQLKKN